MKPNKNQYACDVNRLTRLLENGLLPHEESALTLHLDDCSTCRQQLEELTASPGEWERMRGLSGREGVGKNSQSAFWPIEGAGAAEEANTGNRDKLSSFLAPTDDPAMLGRLGPYEVIGMVGEGGMGVVLKVYERALNRTVAVKVLAPQLAASAAARRRFAREAQAAAAVVHEHVIAIHAVAESGGFPYLVMPYVAGHSLQQRLDRVGPLSMAEILRIGAQAAAGLAAAHAQGLVHRDIKPANILLENGVERVLITDFGLARAVDDATLTCSGIIVGTPQYMAPEQAQGVSLDHRADLFSLGSVMYAMCTGRPPFRAETAVAILRRICEDRPRPIRELNPEIPGWLEELVERLHAKNPADRFQTAAEVAELLERCLAHVQNPSLCPLPREFQTTPMRRLAVRFRLWRKSHWRSGVAALLILSSLGVSVHWVWQTRRSETPDGPAAATSDLSKAVESTVDLQAWDAQATQLRRSVEAAMEVAERSWFDAPRETWTEAQTIPGIEARIQRLDAELTDNPF